MSFPDTVGVFLAMLAANLIYDLGFRPLLWVVFGWDPDGRFNG